MSGKRSKKQIQGRSAKVVTGSVLAMSLAGFGGLPAFADEPNSEPSSVEEPAALENTDIKVSEPVAQQEPAVSEPLEVVEVPVEAAPEIENVEVAPANSEPTVEESVAENVPASVGDAATSTIVEKENDEISVSSDQDSAEPTPDTSVAAQEPTGELIEPQSDIGAVTTHTENEIAADVESENSEESLVSTSLANTTEPTVKNLTEVTPEELIGMLFGDDTKVQDVELIGSEEQLGVFLNLSAFGLKDGVVLSTGRLGGEVDQSPIFGPNTSGSTSGAVGGSGDEDLEKELEESGSSSTITNDAAGIQFKIMGSQPFIKFNYVFGSEEYLEYVDSSFNDIFAFFVNGVNYATFVDQEGQTLPVAINTINHKRNQNLFNSNTGDDLDEFDTGLDGFTVVLEFTAPLNIGVLNTIKLVIADTGDSSLDSLVFFAAGSFQQSPGEEQVVPDEKEEPEEVIQDESDGEAEEAEEKVEKVVKTEKSKKEKKLADKEEEKVIPVTAAVDTADDEVLAKTGAESMWVGLAGALMLFLGLGGYRASRKNQES